LFKRFIHRPVLAIVVSLVLVFLGLLAAKNRPISQFPEIAPPQRFPVRFYLVAMIFIIFDIEIVFMYPFAVVFRELGTFGLVEVVLFSVVVFVSLLFLVSSGALTWGPVKRLTRGVPSRTSESTIARITADPAAERAA
jgi:NADH-quinone oxidoreductase subunit A